MGMYMPRVMMLGLSSVDIDVARTMLVGGPTLRARFRGTSIFFMFMQEIIPNVVALSVRAGIDKFVGNSSSLDA